MRLRRFEPFDLCFLHRNTVNCELCAVAAWQARISPISSRHRLVCRYGHTGCGFARKRHFSEDGAHYSIRFAELNFSMVVGFDFSVANFFERIKTNNGSAKNLGGWTKLIFDQPRSGLPRPPSSSHLQRSIRDCGSSLSIANVSTSSSTEIRRAAISAKPTS